MKKLLSVLLVAVMLVSTLSLFSCSNKYYDEVEPVGNEDETVLSTKYGDVKYDLFRAFYLTYKNGGYSHSDSARMAIDNALDILAVFALCEDMDIDTESRDIYNKVDDIIVACVDGGTVDGVEYQGYGDFDKYLAAISAMYMTDRVNRLIIRYSLCENMLIEKFKEVTTPTNEAVKEYFLSDECIRITWFVSEYRESADRAHAALAGLSGDDAITNVFVQYSLATVSASSQKNGWYLGKSESSQELRNVSDRAFALGVGEYSEVMLGGDGNYYIVYRMEKVASYVDTNLSDVKSSYIYNELGKTLDNAKADMRAGVSYSDFYSQITANDGVGIVQ